MIRTILFDLDRTLLYMDQDKFLDLYFSRLVAWLAARGYNREAVQKHIMGGTMAMIRNDGSRLNERAFWEYFSEACGVDAATALPVFEAFYREVFPEVVQETCAPDPAAKEVVERLKGEGYSLVLATNPLFPRVATECRICRAGLRPSDFIHRTTYENASYSKPNPAYYREILEKLGLRAEECLMVGNDAEEDMAAAKAGLQVFLRTDYLINPKGLDISCYPRGGFAELLDFLAEQNET
jgi:HAD superfamily hydrolase (TIGR01549 family)